MSRVALRGILGRKLRTVLTAFAIVLGVAMVSGTFVLTDTIQKAFDSIFTSAYDNTDAVVTGRKLLEWSASGKRESVCFVRAVGLPPGDAEVVARLVDVSRVKVVDIAPALSGFDGGGLADPPASRGATGEPDLEHRDQDDDDREDRRRREAAHCQHVGRREEPAELDDHRHQ